MIKLENTEVLGWEAAIRGMRNPMNSWEKSDSFFNFEEYYESDGARDCGISTMYGTDILGRESDEWCPLGESPLDGKWIDNGIIGPNDQKLMMNLAKAGSVDAKYRRMIVATVDITAPLYWWKEFDTYKVGTVANSCSTMHKIHSKEFTRDDFSHEHLVEYGAPEDVPVITVGEGVSTIEKEIHRFWPSDILDLTIAMLNRSRQMFLETKDKRYWWQMIQLLPSSYNQRRTVMLNYEVLAGIYPKRKDHKLDEWREFCSWIKTLPYSEIITLEET